MAYADLLLIWQLPIQRSEVLKIGAVTDDADNMHASQYWSRHGSQSTSPKEDPTSEAPTGFEGLDFQRHCANCGHAMQVSIFASGLVVEGTPSKRNRQKPSTQRCSNCKPRQPLPTKLPCVICHEVVDGMLVPCLSCGHVCCFNCHRRWFLRSDGEFDSPSEQLDDINTLPFCPTGCGCNCSEHTEADVPMPASKPPSPNLKHDKHKTSHQNPSHDKRHGYRQSEPAGSDTDKRGSASPKAGVGQHVDDLELWQESSPFASLARGMGGGLSQGLGLGARDRRKNRSVAMTPKGK